jgi:MOSC domain-containing protein YiiM
MRSRARSHNRAVPGSGSHTVHTTAETGTGILASVIRPGHFKSGDPASIANWSPCSLIRFLPDKERARVWEKAEGAAQAIR